jgi:signal transduction histidine kinase
VAGYARAGLEVRFTLEGDPRRLSSAAGLGLYRIAQEALTNVAKHAPGAKATVELRIGEAEATLRIVDSGPAPAPSSPRSLAEGENTSSGMGVMGMRERAALLGGSLTAGRLGAGWQVECTIPLESAAPRETGADVLAEQPR